MRIRSLAALLLMVSVSGCGDDRRSDAADTTTADTSDTTPEGDATPSPDADLADVAADPSGDSESDAAPDASGPVTTPVRALGWLTPTPDGLVDEVGRTWDLRGINARIEGIFDVTFEDGRTPLQPIPPFTAEDAASMARLGFNFLRLPINWSGLEPTEGDIRTEYLDRVDAVVEACRANGIYVLIDFHQDAYSKEIGEDGAPAWAIRTEYTPLEGPLTDLEARRTSAQVYAAFKAFFDNVDDIQGRFLPAWRAVVVRWADAPWVAGFQPMNEPVATFAGVTDAKKLWRFYQLVSDELRLHDTRHALWFEPDTTRNMFLPTRFYPDVLTDRRVVYAPHIYPQLTDRAERTEDGWFRKLDATFGDATAEGQQFGAPVVWGEWGADPRAAQTPGYLAAFRRLSWKHGHGHAFWVWKERSQGFWGLHDWDEETGAWTVRESFVRELMPPMVMAVPGRFGERSWDPATSTLRVRFTSPGGGGSPLLHLPELWYPNGARVLLDGVEQTLVEDAETRRATFAWSGEAGEHEIEVRAR